MDDRIVTLDVLLGDVADVLDDLADRADVPVEGALAEQIAVEPRDLEALFEQHRHQAGADVTFVSGQ